MSLDKALLRQIDNPDVPPVERTRLRCEAAKRLEEAGNYEAARDVMGELWQAIGERPALEGLDAAISAEVLLRIGALTGWIGSTRQIEGAQARAKDLISESIGIFSSQELTDRVAEAQTDLAYCYWREGALDEAPVILSEALTPLTERENDLKAVAMLRSAIVEWSAKRFHDALRILTDAKPLFERSVNDVIRGKFHHGLGFVLRNLGGAEGREDYIDLALIEYAAASGYFEQAGLKRYQACVENNLGFLFIVLSATPVEAAARDAGADNFLHKPQDVSSLVETITRLLEAHDRERLES